MAAPTLDEDELARVTGYRRPAEQLRELKAQGFWRARRSKVTGEVILERPHFESVSSGGDKPAQRPAPRLRLA